MDVTANTWSESIIWDLEAKGKAKLCSALSLSTQGSQGGILAQFSVTNGKKNPKTKVKVFDPDFINPFVLKQSTDMHLC